MYLQKKYCSSILNCACNSRNNKHRDNDEEINDGDGPADDIGAGRMQLNNEAHYGQVPHHGHNQP